MGLIERGVQTFKSRLQKATSDGEEKDKKLSSILLSMRTSVQVTSEFSPIKLLYGVPPHGSREGDE